MAMLSLNMPALSQIAAEADLDFQRRASYRIFSESQGTTAENLTDMIIPSVEGRPGAFEAGVSYFIDRAIEGHAAPQRSLILSGLDAFRRQVAPTVNSDQTATNFAQLTWNQRAEHVRLIDNSAFFNQFRVLTIQGMFAHPRHGGNRDKLGWAMIGFDNRHAWMPPFGYYDAEEHAPGSDR